MEIKYTFFNQGATLSLSAFSYKHALEILETRTGNTFWQWICCNAEATK